MSKYPLIGLLLVAVAAVCSAALPPKYLAVEDFKRCLATQEINGYRAWCLPPEKPVDCPPPSWAELKALAGNDQLPACPVKSPAANPAPAEKPEGQ